MSNYGYVMLDLGRDVPPETIVETAVREKAKLVGLSALMTTTLPAMEETVRQLKGIPNLYYDMAAICEPATMYEVIRQAGHDKVMWGSDYCIDRVRGRASSFGVSFAWFYDYDIPKDVMQLPMNLVCLESLFAFYQASLMLDLTKEQIEDIFYNNAVRLLGLEG